MPFITGIMMFFGGLLLGIFLILYLQYRLEKLDAGRRKSGRYRLAGIVRVHKHRAGPVSERKARWMEEGRRRKQEEKLQGVF